MKHLRWFIFLSTFLFCIAADAQKNLFHADSCSVADFPEVTGKLFHRGYGEFSLKKENLGVFEDGKPVSFNLKPDASAKINLPKNKRILLLVENHYQEKGFKERLFFVNTISYGLVGNIQKGDQIMFSTFDWYRDGKYVFNQLSDYTDDSVLLRRALSQLAPPKPLHNKQTGADIYNSLLEALKSLGPSDNSRLPTAIFLFSDDLDNSFEKTEASTIREKSAELGIPVYAISYDLYPRYHKVIQDEICTPTFGRYSCTPGNKVAEASAVMRSYISNFIRDAQGTIFTFSYTSRLEKNGQKTTLRFDARQPTLSDTHTITLPSGTLLETITDNPLAAGLCFVLLLLAGWLAYHFIKKNKARREEQDKLLQQTASTLEMQKKEDEEEIRRRDEQIQQLTQSQQQKQQAEVTERMQKEREAEEQRLTGLMRTGGGFPRLLFTCKGKSGIAEVSRPIFTIGRDPGNDCCLPDETVSRLHATIFFDEAGFYSIVDHNSANGTLVRGNSVLSQARLSAGDLIQLGAVNITFQH